MSAAIAGIAIGAATVGLGVYNAVSGPSTPSQPNTGQDVSSQINAQIAATPANYASQAQYNPKFAALNSQIAWQNLFGAPASSTTTPVQQTGWYDTNGNFMGTANPNLPGAQYLTSGQLFTFNAPAAPGALATQAAAQPQLLALQSQARAGDLADVSKLGPAAFQSIAGYDPQAAALLAGADQQVQQRLATNGALDPFTQTSLQQNYRAAEAARGLAGGSGDAAMESYYQAATQNARQVQNIGLANQQAQVDQGYYGDPFQQVLSRTSGGIQPQMVNTTANQPSAVQNTASLVNPSLTALQGMGYQAQVDAQNAGYLSQQSGIASAVKSLQPLANSLGNYFNTPAPVTNGYYGGSGAPSGTFTTDTSSYAPGTVASLTGLGF